MQFFKTILLTLLLTSTFSVKAEVLARPEYLDKSADILTKTIQKGNENEANYEQNSDKLIDDANKSIDGLKNGKLYHSAKPSHDIKKYLDGINLPTNTPNECDDSSNLTNCEMAAIKDAPKQEIYVYISTTMPESLIVDALDSAARHNAKVVVRGIFPGKTLNESLLVIAQARAKTKLSPDVSIDPRPFTKFKVTTVPSVSVSYLSDYAVVSGSLDIDYLLKKFNSGDSGRLPKAGTTYDIAETDFVEDLKQRTSKIDFQAMAKKGVDAMWKHQQYVVLPKAKETKSIVYDPSFIVEDDVKLPDGQLIATAGTRFNPQAASPLSKTLIFIDATDKKQIDFAQNLVKQKFKEGKSFNLMTTNMPNETTWATYHELRNQLGGLLYVANQQILTRFKITSLPSTVEGQGLNLKLTEHAL